MKTPSFVPLAILLAVPLLAADDVPSLVARKLDAAYPALDTLYKDLHAHPELSLMEERTAAAAWLGAEKVTTIDPEMGGEDFSQFGRTAEKIPLCLIRVGAVAPEKIAESARNGVPPPTLHSSKFAPVPKPTIKTGVTAMTAIALDLLGKK